MKSTFTALFSYILIALLFSTAPANGFGGRPALEVIEQLSKAAGRPAAKGTTEALERAMIREGSIALDAARRGGLGLPEAAARHGDDVFRFAVRVPESAAALAARSDELLPLARIYGDDFLRLEARVPGLGDDAARLFSEKDSLRRLANLPSEQAREIVSYANYATNAKVSMQLLRAVERGGPEVLSRLDPKKILALGLSSAMIVAATGVPITAITAPEELAETARFLGFPVFWSIGIGILGVGLVATLALAARLGVKFTGLWKRRSASTGPAAPLT